MRAAEAMLRALGGTEVKLRCATGAPDDPQGRQLGLKAPAVEDIPVSPAVVRPSGSDFELLLAPTSITQYIQDRALTAEQFFGAVMAVLHAGQELRVRSLVGDCFAGDVYLYRITLTTNS